MTDINGKKLADGQGMRMRCDYCRRIIIQESSRSIPCTACGHGHLRETLPRNWCCICGEPQYNNVSKPPVKVECSACVDTKVEGIRKLEREMGVDFAETADMRRKCERVTLNKGKRAEGELRTARKQKGWSQQELAIHLGVSKQMVQQMEAGRRPYGEKAKRWLEILDEKA